MVRVARLEAPPPKVKAILPVTLPNEAALPPAAERKPSANFPPIATLETPPTIPCPAVHSAFSPKPISSSCVVLSAHCLLVELWMRLSASADELRFRQSAQTPFRLWRRGSLAMTLEAEQSNATDGLRGGRDAHAPLVLRSYTVFFHNAIGDFLAGEHDHRHAAAGVGAAAAEVEVAVF